MTSAGQLTLDIFPTLKGFAAKVIDQVVGPSADAGARAGAELSRGLVAAAGTGGRDAGRSISAEVTASARSAGTEAGRSIAAGVASGARGAGTDAGRAIGTGVTAEARSAGTEAGSALAAGVTERARTAGTDAGHAIAAEVTTGAREGGDAAGRALASAVASGAATGARQAGEAIATGTAEGGSRGGAEAGAELAAGVGRGAAEGQARAKAAFGEMGKSARELAEVLGAMWLTEQAIDFFKEGIRGAQALAAINRQTAAAIRSTGHAADVSAPEVKELTEKLADLSGKTDDVVQASLNVLLTFPSIRNEAGRNNEVFNQAALAATNLSARMGTDLRSSMVMVGKALNDPIRGVTTLRRVGVQLTQSQQDQVKEFVKSGETMKAQKVILGELGREFAGSAAAATTPAQRLHVAWDRLQVETADKLLPTINRFANVLAEDVVPALSTTFDWVHENWTAIKWLSIAVGGLVAAYMAISKVNTVIRTFQEAEWLAVAGEKAWAAAVWLWDAAEDAAVIAQVAFDAAWNANPVGMIITAIVAAVAALVFAIYELVTHWREVMNALGAAAMWLWHNAIQPAWQGIRAAVLLVYNGAIHPALSAMGVALRAVGAAGVWLYRNALRPAFEGIAFVAKLLAAIVYTVLVTPLYLAFKYVLAPVFMWLYHNVVQPMFSAIGAAARWLYANVFVPIGVGISATIHALGAVAVWLYTNAIHPTFVIIGNIFHWLYENVVRPIIAGIKLEVHAWAEVISWLWQNVIHPTFTLIGNIFDWIYRNIIQPVVAGIKLEIHAWAQVFQWIYDNVIKPVGHAIGDVIHGIGQVFADVVGWVRRTWGQIADIAKVPINFIIKYVYDKGIVPVWNGIAGVFGLGKLSPATPLAGGGILPGYAPGQDTVPVMASPGEGWLVPEAVQAIGPATILAINAAYAHGRAPGSTAGYAGGGVVPGGPVPMAGGGVLGDIWSDISHVAGVVWHGVEDAFTWVESIAGDVAGGVRKLFAGVTDWASHIALSQGSTGGSFVQALQHLPPRVIDGVIAKVKAWFASGMGGGVAGVIPAGAHKAIIDAALAADGVPVSEWGKWEIGLNTLIQRESGWNAGSVNRWDVNAARGTPSGGLAQVIGPTFAANRAASLPNNLFNPVANVAAAVNYILRRYGDITHVQQANANLPPKGYAGGGVVPRAIAPATPVRTSTGGGPRVEINLNGHGGPNAALATELERRLMLALR